MATFVEPAAAAAVEFPPPETTREHSDSDHSSRSASRSEYSEFSESGFFGDSSTQLTPAEREAAKAKQAAAEAALRAQQVGGGKTITLSGSVIFFVNGVTGGGMVLFPGVFQEAGWLVVLAVLIFICLLTTACGFMLIEAMAMMPGNKRFQKRVEYTTIAQHYLPPKLYWIAFTFFQLSLTCTNIGMIVQSCQVMDYTVSEIFGKSCGIPLIYPELWVGCPSPDTTGDISVFGPGVYLVPLGWFIMLMVTVPLGFVNLDDNVIALKGAFYSIFVIIIVWVAIMASNGLDSSRVPLVGSDFSQVVGVIVFNFAVISQLPSWVNEKKENVSIPKTFGISLTLAGTMFLVLGLVGGLAFDKFNSSATLLTAMFNLGTKISKITTFLFPAAANLTSIPVLSIIQRYNLQLSGLVGPKTALVLASFVPWLASIPLYTGSGYTLVVTWSGILVTSVVNFIVPPTVYLLAIRETNANSFRRASLRMMTGLRASGLTNGAGRPESQEGGQLGTNSRFQLQEGSRSKPHGGADGVAEGQQSEGDMDHAMDVVPDMKGFGSPMRHHTFHRPSVLDNPIISPSGAALVSPISAGPSSGGGGGNGSRGSESHNNNSILLVSPSGPRSSMFVSSDSPSLPHRSPLPRVSVIDPRLVSPGALENDHAPAPSLRKIQSKRREREKEREREKAQRRAEKEKARRAEKKRRAKEAVVPDEAELNVPPVLPVLPWVVPKEWYLKIYWACMLPINLLFHYTIPHPSSIKPRAGVLGDHGASKFALFKMWLWAVASITSATGWTAGVSIMIIWCCMLVAEGTTLHPFMLGIFVLGVCLRVPAFWTEFHGYQNGGGDLNRIFLNNVLQILVCVPLPWLIYFAVTGGGTFSLYSGDVVVLFLTLFIMGSMVVIVYRSYDWIASKSVVWPILAMLIFYLVEAQLLEYSVILHLNDEQCIALPQ